MGCLAMGPDDIEYFKPIELHTKYGRTGHIKGKAHHPSIIYDTQTDMSVGYAQNRSERMDT